MLDISPTVSAEEQLPWVHVKGVYLQPSTTQQNSTPKLAEQNPESISQEAIYHAIFAGLISSKYQNFEKLLWKPSQEGSEKSS